MRPLSVLFCALVLTYLYLYPGSQAFLEGRVDTVMSDDSDPASLPFAYDRIIRTFQQDPLRFFYGAVYIDQGGTPFQGYASWMPWNERWLVVALSSITPTEQLSTALVFILMIVNFLSAYALCRTLNWPRWLALSLATAWAFNPYTRARGKVHMALAGIYHLPLLIWALYLLGTRRDKRSLAFASLLLLLSTTVNHYYIVTTAFLIPFWLIFPFLIGTLDRPTVCKRLVIAIAPVTLFLAFNFTFKVPKSATLPAQIVAPRSGEYAGPGVHPFLNIFAARPIDYLGGDISLANEPFDLNPLKSAINEKILSDLGIYGNSHERTNGVRWVIILLASVGMFLLCQRSRQIDPLARRFGLFFAALGAYGFALSLPPAWLGDWMSPAYWLQSLVSQVRVPSRAGILVHFSCLMLAGFALNSLLVRWRIWGPALFALVLLDYPPLYQQVPMAAIRSAYALPAHNCGPGLYFPFINHLNGNSYYQMLQRFRDSGCSIWNMLEDDRELSLMAAKFPADIKFLEALPRTTQVNSELERLARCLPINWIAFDPLTPTVWRESLCRQLGWTMQPDLTCISRQPNLPFNRLPSECR